ncbi:Alcohol oxidase [Pseudocercospora fuligena]|uniref:Alcohol oxidase n=1 Tax=Pseudocercospora fuligena TaxID=685502 RepID=A0A8H6RC89_9PEZI|nr:Alcohol oxidase [Pseudocercospora fuligena]
MLKWNGIDVCGKIRPTQEEVELLGPEFSQAWQRDFADSPSRPLVLVGWISRAWRKLSEPAGQYITACAYSAYPQSRGSIHVTGTSVSDPVNLETGYFSDSEGFDIKTHVWAYKKQREIMRRTKMYRGETQAGHPRFPKGSEAACVDLRATGALQNPVDLRYTAEDDEAIMEYLREVIGSTWHSLGTAKMAPREEGGVVDADLNVYGVSGLKCCDLSIVPKNVGANTANTAFAIGEKCADLIMQELGFASSV